MKTSLIDRYEIIFYKINGIPDEKVQRVQRVQRGRLTGLRPEGCGGGFAAIFKKGARLRRRLYRKVVFASLKGRQRLRR